MKLRRIAPCHRGDGDLEREIQMPNTSSSTMNHQHRKSYGVVIEPIPIMYTHGVPPRREQGWHFMVSATFAAKNEPVEGKCSPNVRVLRNALGNIGDFSALQKVGQQWGGAAPNEQVGRVPSLRRRVLENGTHRRG
jgi:hypothetical protein